MWARRGELDADPTYDDGTDVVGFSAVEDLIGGSDTDDFTFSVAGLSGVVTVDGGGGTDSLTGRDVASTLDLDADPTYDDGTDTVGFSAVEDLLGGTNTDDFTVTVPHLGVLTGGDGNDTFDIDATLTGVVDGGANTDVANFAGVGGALLLTIGTDLLNLETLVGNNDPGSRLTGPAGGNTWTITPAEQGSITGPNVVGLAFSAFPRLDAGADGDIFNFNVAGNNFSGLIRGGAGDDQFVFVDNATLLGSIDGRGSDGDVVNLSAYSSATNVALLDADNADGFDGTATNGGTIVAFDNISQSGAPAHPIL